MGDKYEALRQRSYGRITAPFLWPCLRHDAAIGCLLLAVILLTAGLAHAGYDERSAAYRAGNYTRAFEKFVAGAKAGDPRAQYNLGAMYHHGRGVERNYGWAAVWYLKSARQGYTPAQSNMAVLHEMGLGLSQDYERAAHWYRKAAEEGDPFAQANIGRLYAQGRGVEKDLVLAYRWTFLAQSRTRDPQVRDNMRERLAWLAERMTPDEIAKAQWRVRQWRPGLP